MTIILGLAAEGASRAVQEDGNECLLLCVNAKKYSAIAVQIDFYPTNGSRVKFHFTMNQDTIHGASD